MLYVITSFGNAFLVFSTATTDDIQPKDQTVNRGEDSWSSVQIFASPAGAEEGEEREKATSVDLNTSFGLCTVGTSKYVPSDYSLGGGSDEIRTFYYKEAGFLP